jgi:periplasmic protein TonB
MTNGVKAFMISLILHAGIAGGGMAIFGSMPTPSEAVTIDLSLLDTGCYAGITDPDNAATPKIQQRRCPAMHQQAEPQRSPQASTSPSRSESAQAARQTEPSPVTTQTSGGQTHIAAYLPTAPASNGSGHAAVSSTPSAGTVAASRSGSIKTDAGSSEGSSEQLQQQYTKEHFAYIRKIINDTIRYPRAARIRGQEGTVIVAFTIKKDGTISHPQIISSSGHTLLDEQATTAVLDAAPFPRPPVAAHMRVPVVYRLT